jgi:hypothetical protein
MVKSGTATDLAAVARQMKSQTYAGMVDWRVDNVGLGRQSMEGVVMSGGAVKEVRQIALPAP